MIAHVARSGEDRGRVVLQLGSAQPERGRARGRRPRRPRLPVRDREPVRRGCAALRLRRLRLRARGVADGPPAPGDVARRHDARPAARRAGGAAAAGGARAPRRGAAALARRARRAAAGAGDRLRRVRALERGGAGRAVHRRQRQPPQAAADRDPRHHRARHGGARSRAPCAAPSSSPWRTAERLPALLRTAGRLATVDAPRSCCC